MIRFHPSSQQLLSYVEGSLSPAVSLVVAAHCDMCEGCAREVAQQTARVAEATLEHSIVGSHSCGSELDSMLAQIIQQPLTGRSGAASNQIVAHVAEATISSEPGHFELDGRMFTLPKTLRRYASNTGNWSSLVGKLWQAPVDLEYQGVASFIYMGKGGSVPEHTHRGVEYTLVLDGEFNDGLHHYDTGDFIFMDGHHTHAPQSDSQEGCLVFSIVDQPLHFTSGLARLLNPFSHLFFR